MGYNTIEFLTKVKIQQVLMDFGLSEQSSILAVDRMLELGYIGEKDKPEWKITNHDA